MFLIPLILSHSCVVFCDISFPFWLSLPVYIEYSVANFRTTALIVVWSYADCIGQQSIRIDVVVF
jgi:hypothetical protein